MTPTEPKTPTLGTGAPEPESPGAGESASTVGDGERFGPWLRSQREGREISLEEIADSSKISKRYLEALEAGRFDVLPAGVFTKGFLRQYARYVGLDPEEVLSFYESALQELEEQRQEPEELQIRRPPRGPSNLRYVIVALLLAVLMLAAVWGLDRWRGNRDSGPVNTPSTSSGASGQDASPRGNPAPAAGSSRAASADGTASTGGDRVPVTRTGPAAAEASTSDAESGGAEPVGEGGADRTGAGGDGSDDPGSDDPEPDPPSANAPTSAEDSAAATLAPSLAPSGAPLWVTIDFSDNCWVEAWADGERRVAQLEVQGESLRLEASSEIRVKVGDITAVRFEVNGMPYDPPVRRSGGVVQNLTFDLRTVESLRSASR